MPWWGRWGRVTGVDARELQSLSGMWLTSVTMQVVWPGGVSPVDYSWARLDASRRAAEEWVAAEVREAWLGAWRANLGWDARRAVLAGSGLTRVLVAFPGGWVWQVCEGRGLAGGVLGLAVPLIVSGTHVVCRVGGDEIELNQAQVLELLDLRDGAHP